MTDTTLTITPLEERAIRIRRVFAAPRPLVYQAFTTPALLRRWLGPAAWEMTVCEIDLRVGGSWRYVMHGPDGAVMVMQGTYQELDPPSRIVTTETFDDDWTGGETLNTTVFEDVGDGTEVTITVLYMSTEARDGALSSGMEHGLAEGFDRLTALLSTPAGSEIADRYRRRADLFEAKVAAAEPGRWDDPSPCDDWTARGVVGHIIDMHGAMLRPVDRDLSPAPSLADDPLGAFRSARADVEELLADPAIASSECATPMGTMTIEQHIDGVVSIDLVIHGWDLARALGQDDTIDPAEVERLYPGAAAMPPEMRIPDAFGPGIVVFGPEIPVPDDAPLQDRLLGLMGRDPR
jgi:uncharacterized protein (TIGR03086 family)